MKARMSLYGLEETIDRPIDIIIAQDLIRVLGLDPNTYMIFSSDDKSAKITAGGGMTGLHNTNEIIHSYLLVEGSEEGEEDEATVLRPERLNQGEILQDPDIGLRVSAIRYAKKRRIKVTYFSQSKTLVNSIVEKLRTFDIMNHGQKKHKLEYYFNLPNNLIGLLKHITELKNKRAPKEEHKDVVQYILDNQVQFISRNNTTVGTPYKFDLSVREMVGECTGLCVTDTYTINKEKEDTKHWYLEFEYDIWYHKPTMLMIDYPILVWNTPIDSRYSNTAERPVRRLPYIGKGDSIRNGLFDLARPYSFLRPIRYRNTINIPHHDDFYNYPTDHMYSNVCSILIIVSDEDPYDVLNIQHIPMFNIKPTFINYLLKFHYEATEKFQSLFNFVLYKNHQPDYKNKITMDEHGNITTEFPMDVRGTYRVVMRVLNDLEVMPLKNRNDLNKYIQDEARAYFEKLCKECKEAKKNVVKKNPHKLLRNYYVDELGNIVDEEGFVCYLDGTRIMETVECDCECHKEEP